MESVRFLLNGARVELSGIDPTGTLLNWLRHDARLTGAKEGCAEGDCGACTVLVGELDAGDEVVWRAVNACILFMPMIDGRVVVTVEGLASGGLNPVQQAMVDNHGSQCGFCTPGFIMSLQGQAIGALGTEDTRTGDILAGNLCRCTGYGAILAAARAAPSLPADDVKDALLALRREAPLALAWDDPLVPGLTRRWFSPRTLEDLADLRLMRPDARIVAGATDVGLWVTKQHRVLEAVISTTEVEALRRIEETPDTLVLGAAVRYAEALPALRRLHPDLGELVRRIGAAQVRNAGTIGGNIANGSPIGDMPPALIALGATLALRKGGGRREMRLEDYFIGYGQQALTPGEFIQAVTVPRPDADTLVRVVKLSKRFDSDISAVCAAIALTLKGGIVAEARIAFGGMAATPRRASNAEAAVTGRAWSEASAERAAEALAMDFQPLSDVRGSSQYRLLAAGNLLRRLWRESQTADGQRLLDLEPVDG